ncbi:MarR family winged helix-turn-helix transcriptional regulator [Streptomyces antarcticus]|uniref:MarR family winged helix-turn-helix transcriptional regulator n=1 Tax=Streptomyces antarcticus TaxID=2996458 RepID=UPI00226E9F10|nr:MULTISPECIES: MarR family transcriptional regulator [unclassified Streptomyces]MCY0946399.1 MarR family transcriptional regulator [Streptomyces sp. H34-AA3]MCY0948968.1 MarR family transcriptional regulator [Streptomyces sp. H27-S2]MCZ4086565.1 MarR family transcriptional regulator [Streptomyces sp. H34-S5]
MSTHFPLTGESWSRAELLARIVTESQRHHADYALFSQAMADHVGLHPTDLQCVTLLDREPGPVSTGDIARLTGLTSGSATRLVDRLVKAGIVDRHADPNDRRRSLVTLAPEARERIGAAWDAPGRAFGAVLEGYSDAELTVIADYLHSAAEVGRAQAVRLNSGDTD